MKPLALMTRAWLIAAATCVLAACGGDGGGSDTPSQPATRAYLGDWVSVKQEGCWPTEGVNPATGYQIYARAMLTITQAAGDDLQSRIEGRYYEDARCTRLFAVVQEEGNLRYVGQRVRYLGRGEGTVDRYVFQWIRTSWRDATGASVQSDPLVWQSGQDVSLRVDNGVLSVYLDAMPDGYWDIFMH